MKSAKSAKSADVLFRVILVGVICAILVAGALWTFREPTRSNPTRYRVVQRLTAPMGVAAADSFDPAAHAETRWSVEDIRASWTRVQSGRSATLRSPRFDLPDGFQGVAVTQSPQQWTADRAPLLLWSESPTLTDAQFRRNRRELLPPNDGSPSMFVAAETLQSDERRPVHYLFLHLPAGGEIAATIDSVAIVSSRAIAAGGAGVWRIAADGQTRDAVTTRSTVEYLADIPEGAELAFGVHIASDVQGIAAIRATEVVGGREHLLLESSTSAGRWTDLRTTLRAGHRSSLVLSATASGTPVLASWSTPQILVRDDEPAPNILLYVVDALRADKLGAYGAGGGLTPFLDRLASDGLLFRRAYAAASWTKPSVATLLSSTYPWTHALGARHYTDMLPAGVPMLQTILASSGYVTAQFSPNPFTGAVSGLDRGFDAAFMTTALGHTRAFDVKARDINDRFLAWLASRPRDRFFAYLHAVDTHPPFSASEGTPPSAYERAITEVDREIARLYSLLEELQVADNTLLVVTADHGEAFGEHGQSGHGQSVYDEEVRVPLLMHWPRRGDRTAIDEPVHSVDVAPTLLHYAGVRFDATRFQGRNVLPASPKLAFEGSASVGGPRKDGAPPPSPVVITRFTYPEDLDLPGDRRDMHAIVDYPWKLIVTVAPADAARTRELYRLDSDPGERRNLAAVEAIRARRLETALDAFLANQASARAAFARAHQQPPPRRPVPARDLVDQLRSLGYVR